MRSGVETSSGASRSVTDPRRRHGGHGQARQLLTDDGRSFEVVHRAWRGLATALQWHTLQAGLAALREEERQVLTLAYLEGHTNREIAAMLSVSVSTVRRRMSNALAGLEHQLRSAGAWASAIALVALAYTMRFAGSTRVAKLFGSGGTHGAILLTATGTAGAIVVGLLIISAGPPAQHAAAAPSVTAMLPLGRMPHSLSVQPPSLRPGISVDQNPNGSSARTTSVRVAPVTSDQGETRQRPGCHGHPTSAPPHTPVGKPLSHPRGAPVTHPTAGGCGPHR